MPRFGVYIWLAVCSALVMAGIHTDAFPMAAGGLTGILVAFYEVLTDIRDGRKNT